MSWVADLALGESRQELFLKLVEYDDAEIMKGNFKPYDIRLKYGDETTTIECKADRLTVSTGNIAIEYRCSGKPSGITSTEADYWAIFIEGTREYYLIPTHEITTAIHERKYTRTTRGGDGYRSEMYLFPRTIFSAYMDYIPDTITI